MNPWQDPNFILEIVNAVIAFFGVIVFPVLFFWKRRGRKGINYELLSDAPVLGVGHAKLHEDLEVRLRDTGQVLDTLNQIVVRFWNSGSQPIESDDIDVPIQLTFDEKAEVVSCGVMMYETVSARASVPEMNKVKIDLDSLNRKEDFAVYALVTGYNKEIRYDAHIIGGTFTKHKDSTNARYNAAWLLVGSLYFFLLFNLTFFALATGDERSILAWLSIGLLALIGFNSWFLNLFARRRG